MFSGGSASDIGVVLHVSIGVVLHVRVSMCYAERSAADPSVIEAVQVTNLHA